MNFTGKRKHEEAKEDVFITKLRKITVTEDADLEDVLGVFNLPYCKYPTEKSNTTRLWHFMEIPDATDLLDEDFDLEEHTEVAEKFVRDELWNAVLRKQCNVFLPIHNVFRLISWEKRCKLVEKFRSEDDEIGVLVRKVFSISDNDFRLHVHYGSLLQEDERRPLGVYVCWADQTAYDSKKCPQKEFDVCEHEFYEEKCMHGYWECSQTEDVSEFSSES